MPVTDGIIGQEIAYAEWGGPPFGAGTTPGGTDIFTLTTTVVTHTGLVIPTLVPTNSRIRVEASLPYIIKDATAGLVNLSIQEDGVPICLASSMNIAANGQGNAFATRSYAATPGFHVYEAKAWCTAGGGSSLGGLYAGFIITPFISATVVG